MTDNINAFLKHIQKKLRDNKALIVRIQGAERQGMSKSQMSLKLYELLKAEYER